MATATAVDRSASFLSAVSAYCSVQGNVTALCLSVLMFLKYLKNVFTVLLLRVSFAVSCMLPLE